MFITLITYDKILCLFNIYFKRDYFFKKITVLYILYTNTVTTSLSIYFCCNLTSNATFRFITIIKFYLCFIKTYTQPPLNLAASYILSYAYTSPFTSTILLTSSINLLHCCSDKSRGSTSVCTSTNLSIILLSVIYGNINICDA